ncbi:hypothetical protein JCM11641_004391 [Rhodosporidiobolus odoratus]
MRRAATTGWRCVHSSRPTTTPRVVVPVPVVGRHQSFSSSSPSQFFFRKPQKGLNEIGRDLLQAKRDDRPDVVVKLYPQYVEQYKSTFPSPSSSTSSATTAKGNQALRHEQLTSVLRHLAQTARFKPALRLFNDLSSLFGLTPSRLDHHYLLLAMINSAPPSPRPSPSSSSSSSSSSSPAPPPSPPLPTRLTQARTWIEAMQPSYNLPPTVIEWNLLLQAYRTHQNLPAMRSLVESMRRRGTDPNVVSYNTFISALFEQNRLDEVRKLVKEMRDRGVDGDVWTETALLTGFLEVGELASAREVKGRLETRLAEGGRGTEGVTDWDNEELAAVNALVKFEVADRGFEAGLERARRFKELEGVELNRRTVNTLVAAGAASEGVQTAEEGVKLIEECEKLLDPHAYLGEGETGGDRRTWSVVIKALAAAGRSDEALKVYQKARDRGIVPDAKMVQPIFDALLSPTTPALPSSVDSSPPPPALSSSSLGPLDADSTSTPSTLTTLRNLYDDLLTSSLTYSTAPDSQTYSTLLRACASPSHPDLSWSRTLITDMKRRGVRLDAHAVTWHIVALMRAAGSWEEAFAAYDEIRALDPTALNLEGYNAVISAFISLSPTSLLSDRSGPAAAPAHFILEFLSDMRLPPSITPPSSSTYSLLLTHYSRTPSATQATISHLHSLIKLDSTLDPDIGLFNALMGAYARTWAWKMAYGVWEAVVANSSTLRGGSGSGGGVQVNQRTVSILLDTCGWDGSLAARERGRRVWEQLEREALGAAVGGGGEGYLPKRNRKNWESWIECLCRWGEIEEAEEVVFRRMEGEELGVPTAGRNEVEVLIKFAKRRGVEDGERVTQRVREERPDLWEIKEVRRLLEEETVERGEGR